ncbi:MAG: glycosyltransferase family 39 protein [Chloroflexi bacterium]|nr:glycosyltransferase family 39 protein [Chloroflexota bacterium]
MPLLFIGFMFFYSPMSDPQSFGYDEGVNLMKAVLYGEGYQLYVDIWSDQPPMLTALLSVWRQWFGSTVQTTRMLIVLMSGLLLWSFYQIIHRTVSIPAGLLAVLLLVVSQQYIRLSPSIMIGLPALAFAIVSIYVVILASYRKSTLLLVLSGLLMALSLQTKLYTVILFPAIIGYLFAVDLLEVRTMQGMKRGLRDSVLWFAAATVGFIAVSLFFGSFDPEQIIVPHFGPQTRAAYAATENLSFILDTFGRHLLYLPIAMLGAVWMIKNLKPVVVLPTVWLITTLLFLLIQKPLRYHYVTMFALPVSWLCAYGIEACLVFMQRRRQDHLSRPGRDWLTWIMAFLGVIYIIAFVFYPSPIGKLVHRENHDKRPKFEQQIVGILQKDVDKQSDWLFTDVPYYAAKAGLLVPPSLAVFTKKRITSGALSDDMLMEVLTDYEPQVLLLERFIDRYGPELMAMVEQKYDLLYTFGKTRYYINNAQSKPAQFDSSKEVSAIRYGESLTFELRPVALTGDSGDFLFAKDVAEFQISDDNLLSVNASLRLVDEKGQVWAKRDKPLVIRQSGVEIFREESLSIRFLVPEGTPPGHYDIDLIVYDSETLQPLQPRPAQSPDSATLNIGRATINHPSQTPSQRAHLADFGPLQLIEANSAAMAVSPGDTIPLSLLWQFTPTYREQALVVVAQLLDRDSGVVASLEKGLFDEQHPPVSWSPGELLLDHHVLTVPTEVLPGTYRLIVGVYDLPDRVRYKNNSETLPWRARDYVVVQEVEIR